MRVGSLFSGYGGLELGVRSVLGGTVAWHSEIDPAACRVLAHHWPGVPNLGDVTRVDFRAVEPVDVLTGGFPCQDVSHAGRRAGLRAGTRSGLWSQMARAVEELRPPLLIIENVRGLLSAGADSDMEPCPWCLGDEPGEPPLRALGAVLGDLADLRYDAWWVGVRAADAGAPHGRFRVFVLASPADLGNSYTSRLGGRGGDHTPTPVGLWLGADDDVRPPDRSTAADADRVGRQELVGVAAGPRAGERRPAHPARTGVLAADPGGKRHGRREDDRGLGRLDRPDEVEAPERERARGVPGGRGVAAWGAYGPAVARWERVTGRAAPPATEDTPTGGRRLSARFVEWLMGLPDGWVTGVDGVSRTAVLKVLGNGVVPQQAALAVRTLLDLTASLAGRR